MTDIARQKAKFRQTKEWKNFRKEMAKRFNNKDAITGRPLRKGWALHHLDMDIEHYTELDPDRFIPLNKKTHDLIHALFRYYKKDKQILERLKYILDRMCELNG